VQVRGLVDLFKQMNGYLTNSHKNVLFPSNKYGFNYSYKINKNNDL